MTAATLFIIGSSMAAVAACRINFTLNPVPGHEISTMDQVAVRTIPQFLGGLDFIFGRMAVVAERYGVAD